ncbi:conserved exported hypothetical protein [Tenacibaculum litopenaei]|uniref:collagenase n=1 Tax=Tenacibaculum litopenaei TaxID=396016 RepID=UPI00389387AB
MKTSTLLKFSTKQLKLFAILCVTCASMSLQAQSNSTAPHTPHQHSDKCSRMLHRDQQHKRQDRAPTPPSSTFTDHQYATASRVLGKTSPTCDAGNDGWSRLSPSGLVRELKSVYDYQKCFSAWYQYHSTYTPRIFSNVNVAAVAREMYNISIASNGTYNSGMYGLVAYLHAAIYHEFYQSTVSLDTNSKYWIRTASESFSQNAHLLDHSKAALDILDEYLIILDYDGLRHRPRIISLMKNIMRRLVVSKSWKTINDSSLLRSYARAYNRVFFAYFRGNQDSDFKNAINGDRDFFNLLYQIGTDQELKNNATLGFMSGNAVLELTRMANDSNLLDDVEPLAAQIAKQHPRLSVAWLRCVEAINKYGDCNRYNLCENVAQLKTELENFLFPNSYTFDDDKMRIKTPLAENEVQELYHAAKQVQNQFFRLIQTDQPVTGDSNETLTMVVFGSKQAYENYATYLYGIPTNNGGMYIERRATFYTWDRTVGVESSLSLEALFRHEYVHYLQGRYLIPGFWAETDMYKNDRMVWYEEGMAEFFSGATDTDGIKLLASNVRVVQNNTGKWPSLSTVFNSSYTSGNFHHYHYGNMAWYHWYLNDFGKLKTFFDLTRSDDVQGFDNLVNNLRSTDHSRFNNFLQKVSNGTVTGKEPSTNWLDDRKIAIGNPADIKTEFITLTGNSSITTGIDTQAKNRRFRIDGVLEGSTPTNNNATAAKQLHTSLDNLLKQLRQNPLLNNFQYTVGYFTNIDISSGIPKASFRISGPLRNSGTPDLPAADFTVANPLTITGGKIAFTSETSGYLASISWDFPGGSPTQITNQTTPSIQYNQAGTYDVSLTATGKNGQQAVKTKQNIVRVYDKNKMTYCAGSGAQNNLYIREVRLGSIRNVSEHESYGDFSNQVTALEIGKSDTLTIDLNQSHWAYNAIGAWIDWNNDGDFDDPNEQVLKAYKAGPYTSVITPPNSAVNGTTTLRIRAAYGSESKITPCGSDSYMGEVEDYSIVIKGSTGVIRPPIANFSSNTQRILAGESVNFTNTSLHTPTELLWTFEGGTPNTSTASTPSINYTRPGVYKVSLKATNSAGTHTKLIDQYITVEENVNYCTPSTALNYNSITRVQLGSIDQQSTWSANGYHDYTQQQGTSLEKNNRYTLSVQTQHEHWSGIDVQVWIDWNKDGTFDASERSYHRRGNGPFTGQLAIPNSAQLGKTRMRVRLAYGKTPDACMQDGYQGETEDYTITLVDTTGSTLAPRANPTTATAELLLYPNPSTTGTVTLHLSSGFTPGTRFELVDLKGQRHLAEHIEAAGVQELQLQLHQLTPGVYFIKVHTETQVFTKRILIHK